MRGHGELEPRSCRGTSLRARGSVAAPRLTEPWEETGRHHICFNTGVLWLQRLEGTRAQRPVPGARPVVEWGGRNQRELRSHMRWH